MAKRVVLGFLAFLAAGFVLGASPGFAGMDVNVNIGVPAVVVAHPPEMILVPDTQVYFAPGVEAELFFYRGNWYTRHGHRWYRGRSYNGPWVVAPPRAVPGAFSRLPGDYRTVYVRGERVPPGHLKRHWKHNEEKFRHDRRDHRDRDDHGHGRR